MVNVQNKELLHINTLGFKTMYKYLGYKKGIQKDALNILTRKYGLEMP